MRILHVTTTLDPATGGPPRVCGRLAAAQAADGHDVTIATNPLGAARGAFDEMAAKYPAIDRVRIVEVDAGSMRALLPGAAAGLQVTTAVGAADLVHVHNVWDPINVLATRACRRAGRPYVVQPNGMLDPWAMRQSRTKKRVAMAAYFRGMLDRAAAIVLGHANEGTLIRPLGLTAPTVVARLNGLFPEEVRPLPDRAAFRALHPALGDDPYVVFMGRFHYKKGLDLLAEGFAIHARGHARTRLVMIGVDDGAQADFESRIRAHGLGDRVHLVGALHGDRKWAALAGAACFALPSRQEGFSVAISEALACGLPVVITEDCHYDDVAAYDAGLVVPLDVPRIAAALDVVLGDPAARARMSANAGRLIETEFNFHRVAES